MIYHDTTWKLNSSSEKLIWILHLGQLLARSHKSSEHKELYKGEIKASHCVKLWTSPYFLYVGSWLCWSMLWLDEESGISSADKGELSNVKQITVWFGHCLLCSLLYMSPCSQVTKELWTIKFMFHEMIRGRGRRGEAGHWSLIGPEWSRDLETSLWLVESGHVTWRLSSDWSEVRLVAIIIF